MDRFGSSMERDDDSVGRVSSNWHSDEDSIRDKDLMRKDEAADKREFEIDARQLNITNSHMPEYWQWTTDGDSPEVAKAVSTKWLEVNGSFQTTNLWPDRDYKVLFLTRIEETDSNTETMGGKEVSLKLSLPYRDSRTQRESWNLHERQEKLPRLKSGEDLWHKLEVGQFTMRGPNAGTMHFAIEGLFRRWSGGLVIKGAVIEAVRSQAVVHDMRAIME